ncbi:MAG: hypothetical protein ACP5GY_06035 [Vulcanisaeta sp.]
MNSETKKEFVTAGLALTAIILLANFMPMIGAAIAIALGAAAYATAFGYATAVFFTGASISGYVGVNTNNTYYANLFLTITLILIIAGVATG